MQAIIKHMQSRAQIVHQCVYILIKVIKFSELTV